MLDFDHKNSLISTGDGWEDGCFCARAFCGGSAFGREDSASPPEGKALAAAPEKAKRPRLRSLQPGAKILRGTTLFLPGAASRRGPCRLRQRRCLQPDAVTGVPGAGLGQPPLAGATLRPCSASCSPPVSTIGALWLRQCQKPTLLFLVFVWFFVYVHHYSVAAPLCQWGRSAKSSRHFAARAGQNP